MVTVHSNVKELEPTAGTRGGRQNAAPSSTPGRSCLRPEHLIVAHKA